MARTKRTHKKKQKRSLRFFGTAQFFVGLALIIFGSGILIYTAFEKVTWTTKPPQTVQISAEEISEKPAKIYVPALKRTLNISDGYIDNGRWAISDTGVSYLTTSALPGKTGNTVIYGHNTQDILGGLWRVQNGDAIYIVLASGEFIKYQVFERKEVKPNQVEILTRTDDKRLTIYTCSGFLDTARFVVVAQEV